MTTLLDGSLSRIIETPRLAVRVIERDGDDPATAGDLTVVLLHGLLSSAAVWQDIAQNLPSDLRVVAVDLRGHGGSENLPVDAAHGVRDLSDDLHAVLEVLEIDAPHLVGWSLGAAVALQYAIDHPTRSLTLESPISPFGLGGTRRDGSLLAEDGGGSGAGIVSPDLVERLMSKDTGDDAENSPRSFFRAHFVALGFETDDEDLWVDAMLETSTATGNYPGDVARSDHWTGFAPGTTGVVNALAPTNLDLSGIVGVSPKPPILWIRGELDAMVSDTSLADANQLGALGILPGWPGADAAPPQPMVTQTRDVLAAYEEAGGSVTELVLDGVGHTPHLEQPSVFRQAVLRAIGYVGDRPHPAPPTETIILRSAD